MIYSNAIGGFKGKVSYQTNDDQAVKVADVAGGIKTTVFPDVKRKYAYAAAVGYDFDFGLGFNGGYAYSDLEGKTTDATGKKSGGLWAHTTPSTASTSPVFTPRLT